MSAQQQPPISFDEVRQAYTDYYTQNGAQPNQINTTDAILHLVSTTGELASYAQSGALDSDFEKQEVHDVVGSLAISLAIIGEAFGVDPGDAALCRIDRLRRRSKKFGAYQEQQQQQQVTQPTRTTAKSGAPRQSQQRGLHIDPHAAVDPSYVGNGGDDAPLSPNTASNFFPMLDSLDNVSPQEIEKMGITWCVPGPGGKLISLDGHDGKNQVVTAARWHEYLERVAPWRAAAAASAGQYNNNIAGGVDVTVSARTTPGALPLHLGGGTSYSAPAVATQVLQPPQQMQQNGAAHIVPPVMTGIPPLGGGHDPQVVRRVTVNTTKSYDPQQEAQLFSPSHFSRDLFSPHNAATSFDVPYDVAALTPTSREEIYASTTTPQHAEAMQQGGVPSPSIPQPEAPMVQLGLPPTLQRAFTQQQQQQQQQPAPFTQAQLAGLPPALQRQLQDQQQQQQQQQEQLLTQYQQSPPTGQSPVQQTPPSAGRVGVNLDEAEVMFWDRFAELETGRAQGQQIAQLGLFFVMPNNGQWIELTTSGGSTPVTATNVVTFMHLLKEQQKQLHGRLRRAASMKTLAIKNIASYNPQEVASMYSPRHNEHGLFAPHTNETTFQVDESQSQDILPEYLKTPSTLNQGFSNPSQYVDHIQGKKANFMTILDEITLRPEAVRKFKVTYCVPSEDGKVTDLVQDGRHRMVNPGDVPNFLGLVEKTMPDLKR